MKIIRLAPFLISSCLTLVPTLAKQVATANGASAPTCFFQLGVEQLDKFRPDQSIRSFSKALLASKSKSMKFRATVFLMIGRSFQADENDLAAAQAITIAHELAPNDQTITAYLADALVRCGRRKAAEPYYKWLTEQKEKTHATLEILAIEASRLSELDKAKQYLETALNAPGSDQDPHLRLLYARLLSKLGLSSRSGAEFKKAAEAASNQYVKHMAESTVYRLGGEPKKQIESLKAAGLVSPNEPNWHSELADCYAQENKKNEALNEFNLSMSGRLSSRAFLRAASFLRHEKRYQDALNVSTYLSKLKPWSADAFLSLGSTYLAQKDYKKAEVELKKAISIDKYAEAGYTDLARCYIDQSKFDKAREVYNEALSACPNSIATYKRLGSMEAKQKNDDAVRHCYEKIIALVPNVADVNVLIQNDVATAHARLGSYFYRDKEFDKALESAKMFNQHKFVPPLPPLLTLVHMRPAHLAHAGTAVEKEYNDHIMLADMLREGGRLDDCIAEYRKAEVLNSDDIDVHSFLLNALDEKGDWIEAAKEDLVLSNKLINKMPAELKKLTDKKPKLAPLKVDTSSRKPQNSGTEELREVNA